MALAFSLTFSPWSLFSSTNWKSFKVWIAKMFSLHCWATYKHQEIFQNWTWHKTSLKTECGIRLFWPSHCQFLWDTPTALRPCIHVANSCHGRLVFSKSFALSQRMPPEKEKWEISQHVTNLMTQSMWSSECSRQDTTDHIIGEVCNLGHLGAGRSPWVIRGSFSYFDLNEG